MLTRFKYALRLTAGAALFAAVLLPQTAPAQVQGERGQPVPGIPDAVDEEDPAARRCRRPILDASRLRSLDRHGAPLT